MSGTTSNPFDLISLPPTPPHYMDPDIAEMEIGAGGVIQIEKKTLEEYVPPTPRGIGNPAQEGALLTTTGNPDLPLPEEKDSLDPGSTNQRMLGQILVGMVTQQFMTTPQVLTADTVVPLQKPSQGLEDLTFIREANQTMLDEEPAIGAGTELPPSLVPEEGSPTLGAAPPASPTYTPPAPSPASPSPYAPSTTTAIFDLWLTELQASIKVPIPKLPETTKAILDSLKSQDESEILQTLYKLAGIDTLVDKTKEEIEICKNKLATLSAKIVKANKGGGSPMQSLNPLALLIWIREQIDTPFSPEHPTLFDTVVQTLVQGIAQANSDAITKKPETTTEFEALVQGSSEEVLSVLMTSDLLSHVPKNISQTEFSSFLRALSATIVSQRKSHKNLQSIDKDTLLQVLQELINGITPAPIPALVAALLPTLVKSIAAVNTKQMGQWVYSDDPNKVKQALTELSGLHQPEVHPATRKVVGDYLSVLTGALILLAQIRCYISQLDGMTANESSKAKMNNAAAELKISSQLLEIKLDEASKTYKSNAAAVATSKVLKVVMPLIALIVAVISLVMIIATCGVGSPAAITLTVAAIAACVATIVIEAADFFSSAISGKGIFEQIFEACNITDETTKAWIQTAITAGLALLTLVASIGTIIASVIKAVEKAALDAVWKAIKEAVKKLLTRGIQSGILMMVSNIMTAPIIPQAIKNSLKAAGVKEEDAAIWSMIITTLLALLPMLLAMASSGGSSIAKSIQAAGKNASSSTIELAQQTAKKAATAVKSAISLVAEPVKEGFSLEKLVRFMRLLIQRIIKPAEFALQSTTQIIRITSNLQLAELKKMTADKALAAATLEAFSEEMNQLYKLGPEAILKMINDLEQESQKQFTSMVRLIDDIITSASQFTTKLHSKGAA